MKLVHTIEAIAYLTFTLSVSSLGMVLCRDVPPQVLLMGFFCRPRSLVHSLNIIVENTANALLSFGGKCQWY